MSRRTERLASTIQSELATIILHDLSDPRLTGMPSITRVRVSPDLSQADVYVTIMGTSVQQNTALNALKHSAGMMRSRLTKALTLRVAPFLKFHIDEQLKKEIVVLDLIRQAAAETAELDRKRAEAAGASSTSETSTPETSTPDASTQDTSAPDTSSQDTSAQGGSPGMDAQENPGLPTTTSAESQPTNTAHHLDRPKTDQE